MLGTVNITTIDPTKQRLNDWPEKNSWLMLESVYRDLIAIRDALNSTAGSVIVDVQAAQYIPPFIVVTSEGKIADSGNVADKNKIVGVSLTSAQIGFMANVTVAGTIKNPAWTWTRGDKIFLNGMVLDVTPGISGFSVLIGTATDVDTIEICIQPSVLL